MVFAAVVLQGLTITPLTRWLKIVDDFSRRDDFVAVNVWLKNYVGLL